MRKALSLLAVILFVCSFIQMAKNSQVKTDAVYKAPQTTSAPKKETKIYTVSSETPFEGKGKERFVAHRGFSGQAVENSLPSFEMAGKSGFWGIETDIVQTKDGVFVCMHDETLDRTTTGKGKVKDFGYAELMNFSLKDDSSRTSERGEMKIPAMVEFLNNCVIYDCVPLLEIKQISDYAGFLQTIKNSGLYHRTIIAGDIASIREIRKIDKEIMVLLVAYATLDFEDYEPFVDELVPNGGLLLNAPLITEQISEKLHEKGLKIGAWTLDTNEDAQHYISLGADFVVTNEIPGINNHLINTNE